MKLIAWLSSFPSSLFQTPEKARRNAAINEIVCELSEVFGQLHVVAQFNPAQTAEMFEIVGWKRSDPLSEAFGNEPF